MRFTVVGDDFNGFGPRLPVALTVSIMLNLLLEVVRLHGHGDGWPRVNSLIHLADDLGVRLKVVNELSDVISKSAEHEANEVCNNCHN